MSGSRAAADLAGLVRDSVAAGAAREVLHLRLGALPAGLRRAHHRRLLRQALDPALAAARTRVFELPNGDVVAVAPPPSVALAQAGAALRRSLDGAAAAAVASLRLPDAAATLLALAAESLGLEPSDPSPPGPPPRPFGTAELAVAERILGQTEMDALTRVETVCRLDPDGAAPRPLWEDRRPDWPAILETLLPGRSLDGTAALARRLGTVVERRLLACLARPGERPPPCGLSLGPAVILGPGFRRVVDALPLGARGAVTVALRPRDLLAMPAAWEDAALAVRRAGLRLALDDLPADALGLLAARPPGLGLIRLRWSSDLAGGGAAPLRALLAEPGAADRVVLAGADRPAAIAWGWEAGLRLFQGRVVERRHGPGGKA